MYKLSQLKFNSKLCKHLVAKGAILLLYKRPVHINLIILLVARIDEKG